MEAETATAERRGAAWALLAWAAMGLQVACMLSAIFRKLKGESRGGEDRVCEGDR